MQMHFLRALFNGWVQVWWFDEHIHSRVKISKRLVPRNSDRLNTEMNLSQPERRGFSTHCRGKPLQQYQQELIVVHFRMLRLSHCLQSTEDWSFPYHQPELNRIR